MTDFENVDIKFFISLKFRVISLVRSIPIGIFPLNTNLTSKSDEGLAHMSQRIHICNKYKKKGESLNRSFQGFFDWKLKTYLLFTPSNHLSPRLDRSFKSSH